MTHDEMLQLIEAIHLVEEVLKSKEKTAMWMVSRNPLLGGYKPFNLFLLGRGHKVLSFIRNAKEGNLP